jgi:hypothetical protein
MGNDECQYGKSMWFNKQEVVLMKMNFAFYPENLLKWMDGSEIKNILAM